MRSNCYCCRFSVLVCRRTSCNTQEPQNGVVSSCSQVGCIMRFLVYYLHMRATTRDPPCCRCLSRFMNHHSWLMIHESGLLRLTNVASSHKRTGPALGRAGTRRRFTPAATLSFHLSPILPLPPPPPPPFLSLSCVCVFLLVFCATRRTGTTNEKMQTPYPVKRVLFLCVCFLCVMLLTPLPRPAGIKILGKCCLLLLVFTYRY